MADIEASAEAKAKNKLTRLHLDDFISTDHFYTNVQDRLDWFSWSRVDRFPIQGGVGYCNKFELASLLKIFVANAFQSSPSSCRCFTATIAP